MKLILKPKPPFNFDFHWRFFSFSKPIPEIYENGVWKRALRLKSGSLMPLKVREIGSIEKPKLEVLIFTQINEKEKQELEDKLAWIFNTDYNLKGLYTFMEKDPVLKGVKEKLYGLRPFNYATVFEGVVKSIIQQQISLIGSMYITNRLVEKFGEMVKVKDEVFYEFPAPTSLSEASLEELKGCGLSKQKVSYIKSFSEKVASREFDSEGLKKLQSKEIIEELTKFKGIGRWTAELIVVTSTGKEALPADDLGARRAVSNFYFNGQLIPGEKLREFSERWGKFRGIITYYLICAERLG